MNSVLIINANNNTSLAIVRGLGAEGVTVDGVGFRDSGVGMLSRYLRKKYYIESYKELTALRLNEILSETGAKYIMAMGEDVLTHINTLRSGLAPGVKCLFPEQKILDRAFDKSITLKYAKEAGIDIPGTLHPQSLKQVKEALEGLKFPVVLKFPVPIIDELPSELKFKYRYIYTPEQLTDFLEPYEKFNIFPLIQEYIPGKGIGVELCISRGAVTGLFQHERIHEFPVAGGVSVYCRSVPLSQELVEKSVKLLRGIEWEGVAMVEYRYDPASGRTVLMEINGRFWGSLPLAVRSGVNFPFLLYSSMGEGHVVMPDSYIYNVRLKQFSTHLKWFADAFFVRKQLPIEGFMGRWQVLKEFILSFNPVVKYAVEYWKDPVPGLVFWLKKIRN